MKTDLELQLALAKMLPEKITVYKKSDHDGYTKPVWHIEWKECECHEHFNPLLDTEWLHVCWLIEQGLTDIESQKLKEAVYEMHKAKVRLAYSASWQQRANALIAVKGEK